MRKSICSVAAISIAAVSLIAATNTTHTSTTHTISVRDDSYSRSTLSIPRGDKITWRWRGTGNSHNVTTRSTSPVRFASKTEDGRFTFSHRFSKKGTYKIFCSIHPSSMKTTIKVK